MRVLILGASGYVGSHLVPALVARGHTVRAAGRNESVLRARGWPGVEVVAADALRPETLGRALEGVEVAYYLVHSMGGGRDFAQRDREAGANFRDAASAAGVARIIYLGGPRPPGEASAHLRSRLETGEVLRAGRVPVTELRAGIIVGPGSAGFEVLRDLVNHLPVMVTPRWVNSRTQPIALRDLVEYLAQLVEHPETAGETYDATGPETLRYRDLLTQFAEVRRKRRWFIPVPVLTPRLSSYWLDLVTSVPASVARPLVEGLKHDLVGDGNRLAAIIPLERLTYREAVRAALAEERTASLPARWTEGALAFRSYNPDVSFYSKGETTTVECAAPAAVLWQTVSAIGGRRGYYYANVLWELRGILDRLVGGVGMRRGRRHPQEVRAGDAIDFWRVASVEPGRRLTLVAEMKLPGAATLEFEVEGRGPEHSALTMTARFAPSGVGGLLYWHSVKPVHGPIFRRTPERIARVAEVAWTRTQSGGRAPQQSTIANRKSTIR